MQEVQAAGQNKLDDLTEQFGRIQAKSDANEKWLKQHVSARHEVKVSSL